jgi:flagellar motor switch protein FliG
VDEAVKEFHGMLTARGAGGVSGDFIRKLLAETVGPQGSKEILEEVDDLVQARDPFLSIRSAAAGYLAEALRGEAPQAVAVVLAELPARKSAELLGLLEESARGEVVMAMATNESASPEVRLRIARVVREQLSVLSRSQAPGAGRNQREQKLRKVAVMLRSMASSVRDQLTAAMTGVDEATGNAVRRLMVTWEDLPVIADRPLQEALRTAEAKKLATALSGAEAAVTAKVRANISEQAGALLDRKRRCCLRSSPRMSAPPGRRSSTPCGR